MKNIDLYKQLFTQIQEIGEPLLVDAGSLEPLLDRARQKPMVLVVGEFNAGKSSLINSALGENLLPVGITPTTSLTTTLVNGAFKITIKPIGLSDPVVIEPGKASTIGYGIPGGDFDWRSYAELLTNPENIEKFEQVTISHPLVPAELEIVDTPGINDIAKSRAEVVYGLIPKADVVLFVISALKPFSESERIFLEEKLLANDLKKIIFVVNRIDEIEAGEREELLAEIAEQIRDALNTAYTRIRDRLGESLFPLVTEVSLYPTNATELAPLGGQKSRGIGFDLGKTAPSAYAIMNRKLWDKVLEVTTKKRQEEVDLFLHHYLRRGLARVRHAIDDIEQMDLNDREASLSNMSNYGDVLEKLRDFFQKGESKIQLAETELKSTFATQIKSVIDDLSRTFRLQRNPDLVNAKLHELYEYISTKIKATLSDLYHELGHSFDTVIDDKTFMEKREFAVEYDLSNIAFTAVASWNLMCISAFFFGLNVGLVAFGAYFLSSTITNKRALKDFFMTATVSGDDLKKVNEELIELVDREVEYAVDYIRQTLVQRVDAVQTEVKTRVRRLQQPRKLDLEELKEKTDQLAVRINGFLAEIDSPSKAA